MVWLSVRKITLASQEAHALALTSVTSQSPGNQLDQLGLPVGGHSLQMSEPARLAESSVIQNRVVDSITCIRATLSHLRVLRALQTWSMCPTRIAVYRAPLQRVPLRLMSQSPIKLFEISS
jgi:hypothetical protein